MQIIKRLPKGQAMWQSKDAEGRKIYVVGNENREPQGGWVYSRAQALKNAKES